MTITERACRAVLIALILFSGGLHLVRIGLYGWTLFALIPVVLGGLVTWVVSPRSMPRAAATAALGAGAGSGLFLLIGVEGVVCIFMALPFVMALERSAVFSSTAYALPGSARAALARFCFYHRPL